MIIITNVTYTVLRTLLRSVLTLLRTPISSSALGITRYGVLTLRWVILTYSGLLERLGPAITQLIPAHATGKTRMERPAHIKIPGSSVQ